MNSKLLSCLLAVAACLPLGCDVDPATIDSLRETINTVSAQPDDAPPLPAEEPLDSALVSFEPPHPDRSDPFTFVNATTNEAGATNDYFTHIEVLGFANVNEPRVLIRAQNRTQSLRVGDTLDNMEVVAIHKPVVKLKTGTLVWTATMHDKTDSRN